MNLKLLLMLSMIFIFTGCSKTPQKINIESKPKYQIPKKPTVAKIKKGSVYSRKGASLFSDKKDLQIGDIIQVYIEETLTNESTNSRENSKDNKTALEGGKFTAAEGTGLGRFADKLNNVTNLGFTAGTKNSFKGESTESSDEEFTTTVSAIIEETYKNGNYFIRGSKQLLINGQKQNIQISGVIRPYDISPDNTVYSYQLANLKILYEKEGKEMDSLEKPWGSKALETIWPF
ncbi:MAG: flagellar basal body L-ring protein FlgH [Campylobacterota bacterium]|nr:flagellar basal body L-ring protein FlgH [Campylobacterota bacterium]